MATKEWHFVNVGVDGGFSRGGLIRSSPDSVRRLVDELRSAEAKRLLLLFHGGLVGETRAGEGIDKIHGALAKEGITPVYFVWETSFQDILVDVLKEMGAKWFRVLVKIVEAILRRRAGLSVASTDVIANETLDAEAIDLEATGVFQTLRVDADFVSAVEKEADVLVEATRLLGSLPDEVQERMRSENLEAASTLPGIRWAVVGAIRKVVVRCVERFKNERDHGLACTILEEIMRVVGLAKAGARIWSEMKQRAFEMWLPNAALPAEPQHAGRCFLEELGKASTQGWKPVVDVAGHSAGAVAVCELLKTLDENRGLGLTLRNVVFHAPACTHRQFVADVLGRETCWAAVRVFTMKDASEVKDSCFYIYRRSLLYFISGVLEYEADAPLLGLERQVNRSSDPGMRKFFGSGSGGNRLVLSPTSPSAPVGFRSDATSHAGFATDEKTLASLVEFCR